MRILMVTLELADPVFSGNGVYGRTIAEALLLSKGAKLDILCVSTSSALPQLPHQRISSRISSRISASAPSPHLTCSPRATGLPGFHPAGCTCLRGPSSPRGCYRGVHAAGAPSTAAGVGEGGPGGGLAGIRCRSGCLGPSRRALRPGAGGGLDCCACRGRPAGSAPGQVRGSSKPASTLAVSHFRVLTYQQQTHCYVIAPPP